MSWKPTNKKVPFSQTDNFYFRREILDANRPFQYTTDVNRWKPIAECAQYIPGVGQSYTGGGWAQNKIDIDSDLRRQFRPLSNCPSKKYGGGVGSLINCKSCNKCNMGLPCSCKHCKDSLGQECQNQIIPEQTRAFGKSCNIPGAFFNNFVNLSDNLQALDKIDSNQKIGLDSRNVTKDGFLDKNYKSIAKNAKLSNKNCYNVLPSNY